MKKLLSFIVVLSFTTYTAHAQELNDQLPSSGKLYNDQEMTVIRTSASEEVRGRVLTDLNGNRKIAKELVVLLYPNPSSDLLNICFNSNSQSEITIEIFDILGKKVFDEKFTAQIGNNVHSLFINHFKNGLYYVKVKNESELSTERFTKN